MLDHTPLKLAMTNLEIALLDTKLQLIEQQALAAKTTKCIRPHYKPPDVVMKTVVLPAAGVRSLLRVRVSEQEMSWRSSLRRPW